MELEVGADDLVKEEKESLVPSTPQHKDAEQQEEMEKVVRSEETAKEKESVGPSTPTHLNQNSRAVLDYDQVVKGKHRSVDTVSRIPIVKGSPTASEKQKKAYKSTPPVWQPNFVRRSSAFK